MRSPLRDARLFARRSGRDVFLVGGAVRDRLLGRRAKDYDLALAGDEEKLARVLSKAGHGRAIPLTKPGARFPVWRLSRGSVRIDVARFEGGATIHQDLARRDFTVNAMAIGLRDARLHDPFGGRADLMRGRIRAVSAKNLADDPVRILRAYRLAATHGWAIDRATRSDLRRLAPRLARCAPERIREEILRLLGALRPGPALEAADEDGVLRAAFGLRPRTGTRGLARRVGGFGPGLPLAERTAGRMALLLRGLGLSARTARRLLGRRKFSGAEARASAARLDLLEGLEAGRCPEDLLFEIRRDRGPLLRFLRAAARVGAADLRGRCRRILSASRRLNWEPAPVDGNDIAAWLGLPPGPILGRALELARRRFFTGEWPDRKAIRSGLLEIDRPSAVM